MSLLNKIIPKSYTYTAGAPDSNDGFKFIVDVTPQVRKDLKTAVVAGAGMLSVAIIFSALLRVR